MADLSITAANVVGSNQEVVTAGATITAGQAIYLDTANSNVAKLAQADGTELEATCRGIALAGAATGQPLPIHKSGEITIGATVSVGTVYVVSATAGGIAPVADLQSGEYLTIIGYASAAGKLTTNIIVTDTELA